tara:strand:- start:1219 stop:1842 length:624 start_codon:yes stop_codon:yes gene_type:complete
MMGWLQKLSASLLALGFGIQFATAQETYNPPASRVAYNDWLVECFERNEIGQECQVYQRVIMNNGSAIAMVATLAFVPPENYLGIQVALPLGIDLKRGATITIDDDASLDVGISRCTQQGCLFEGTVTDALEMALREGEAASVTVTVPSEGNFTIPLSLNGFSAALDEIAPIQPSLEDLSEAPLTSMEAPSQEEPVDNTLRPVTGSK